MLSAGRTSLSSSLLIDERSMDYSIEGDSSRELTEGDGNEFHELLQDLQHSSSSDSEDSNIELDD